MTTITIIGTGSWGTTLAIALARAERRVMLVARTATEAAALDAARTNQRFVPGVEFPATLTVTADAQAALAESAVLLLVTPSQTLRLNVRAVRAWLPPGIVLLSCAKGLERGSLLRMSQVIASEVPPALAGRVGALSGPNISHEVAVGQPATSVVATPDHEAAVVAQRLLNTLLFRVYTTQDVVGVELAGAFKNIIALGAGISDGLGFGDNAKAALMTRGLAEISRLALALGAHPLTCAGLAGLGDLVATCASPHSRNRRLGEALAHGLTLEAAQAQLGQVAEGVTTVQTALALAAQHGVEMPITTQMAAVLFHGKSPQAALVDLMQREAKHELG